MSEVESIQPKSKQFLVMVDELNMAFLSKIIPSLLFVQVEGFVVADNPQHQFLVNPIPQQAPVELENAIA